MATVAVSLILAGTVAAVGHQLFGRKLGHYDNSVRARALTVGMTRSAVIDVLGDPIAVESGWTYFQSSPTAEHLRMRFNDADRLVEIDAASTRPAT
jgi:outer membrane protein assembly factor BamE (lipoprotein component of BamABCDE complex)